MELSWHFLGATYSQSCHVERRRGEERRGEERRGEERRGGMRLSVWWKSRAAEAPLQGLRGTSVPHLVMFLLLLISLVFLLSHLRVYKLSLSLFLLLRCLSSFPQLGWWIITRPCSVAQGSQGVKWQVQGNCPPQVCVWVSVWLCSFWMCSHLSWVWAPTLLSTLRLPHCSALRSHLFHIMTHTHTPARAARQAASCLKSR